MTKISSMELSNECIYLSCKETQRKIGGKLRNVINIMTQKEPLLMVNQSLDIFLRSLICSEYSLTQKWKYITEPSHPHFLLRGNLGKEDVTLKKIKSLLEMSCLFY